MIIILKLGVKKIVTISFAKLEQNLNNCNNVTYKCNENCTRADKAKICFVPHYQAHLHYLHKKERTEVLKYH